MPSRRREKQLGAASLGVAATGTVAAVNTNRVANAINNAHQRRYDRKLVRLEGVYGLSERGKPVAKTPTRNLRWQRLADGRGISRGAARNLVRESSGQKAAARRKAAQVIALKTKRKAVPITPKGRSVLMRSGMVAAAGGMLGSRYLVEKRELRRRDLDVALPSAVVGGAAYQGAGYAIKPYEKKVLHRYTDEQNREARAHKKKVGLPNNAPAGHGAWRTYNRTFPKHLPAARLKRVLAVTHTGPTGVAATGAAALAAAGGAVHLRRKDKTVKKNLVPLSKAKRFDPEAKRLKRLDTYSALAAGGAAGLTGAAVVDGAKRVGAAGNLRQRKQAKQLARAISGNDAAMRTYMENLKPASRGAEGKRIAENTKRVGNLKFAASRQRQAALRTALRSTPNLKRVAAAGGLVAVAGGLQAYKRSDRVKPYQGYRVAGRNR